MGPDVVVPGRALEGEFEDSVGEGASTDENDTVEQAQVVEGWDEVDSPRTVLFEVPVFDAELVVSHRLLAFYRGGSWLSRAPHSGGTLRGARGNLQSVHRGASSLLFLCLRPV
mmetsp:Transcript_13317/g.32327  ORF Transcript_13317/g.32327 Transcript_13317/m.32327 type:complete len:113 (+) Transcript_13317:883-1221(+)